MREILVDFEDTYDYSLAFAVVSMLEALHVGVEVICVDRNGLKKPGTIVKMTPARVALNSFVLTIKLI